MPSELSTTRLETPRSRSDTLNSDDFTQRRFLENRPSLSRETLPAYQFLGFSDTAHPTIPEAAKTAIRQCQEQLLHHQAHLATLQITLERLQTHEATLQSHIAESTQTQQHFKDQYHELLTTARVHEHISTSALELFKASIARQQTTGTIAALRYLQTELRRSTRPQRQEKARLQELVRALDALTTSDDGIYGIIREYQADTNARQQYTEEYKAACLALRKQLNIDGLFEEMSNRHAASPAQPESEKQLQVEMQQMQEERETLQAHLHPLQVNYDHVKGEKKSSVRREQERLSKEIADTAHRIDALEKKQLERIMGITSIEYATLSAYPPSLETLPPEIHEDVKHLLDSMRQRQQARDHYTATIDQQHILPPILHEVESEAPLYHALTALQIEQAPNETTEAFHQRLMDSLPRDVPEHIQQTSEWQQLQLTYDEYARQRSRKQYATKLKNSFIQLKPYLQFSQANSETSAVSAYRLPDDSQIEQAPNESVKAYHQRLLRLLPHDAPDDIQHMEYWQNVQRTYDQFARIDPPSRDKYVQMQLDALSSLKQSLQARDELLTHLQGIQEGRRAERELPTIQQEVVDLLVTHISDSSLQKLSPEAQTMIRARRDHRQHTSTASKVDLEIPDTDQRQMIAHTMQELETEAPLYRNLQSPAVYQMEEAYHWWLIHHLPPNVPEHIQQTDQWQQLRLTYEEYEQSHPQAQPDSYITMKQEALTSLKDSLLANNQFLTYFQAIGGKRGAEQDRINIQQKLVGLLSDPSLQTLSSKVQKWIRDMHDQPQPTNEASAASQELTYRQLQLVLQIMHEIDAETPTLLALQHFISQRISKETPKACHERFMALFPQRVPQHIWQTDQWQQLRLTYAQYRQSYPQAQPSTYIQMKRSAATSLMETMKDRSQLLAHLEDTIQWRSENQELLKTLQQLETEAPLYAALQRFTTQQVPDQMGEAYHWWTMNFLPPNVPEHIQQTDHWQQVQLTYAEYAQSHPQARLDYITMKQEALHSLKTSLHNRSQLSRHLQGLKESQNILKTVKWRTESRKAYRILQQLPINSGSNMDKWLTLTNSLKSYFETARSCQAAEESHWNTIARKGKAIYQQKAVPTELDQALLHAYETHRLSRERLSNRQHHLLQNVAALTDIPLEQPEDFGATSNQLYQFSDAFAAVDNTTREQHIALSQSTGWEPLFPEEIEALRGQDPEAFARTLRAAKKVEAFRDISLEKLMQVSKSKSWEHQFSRIASILTNIPLEQRKALSAISDDRSRPLLERATHLERALSEISAQLHTRLQQLKDSIDANHTTSKLAAQLIDTMVSLSESTTAQAQRQRKLQKMQKRRHAAEKRRTDLEQAIATTQTHITTIQTSMEKALDKVVATQRKALQKTRKATRTIESNTESEIEKVSNKKTYQEFLESLATQKTQLAGFDSVIDEQEKTLQDLENSESPEYAKYSQDLISNLQEKVDKSLASMLEDVSNMQQFSADWGLPADGYILHAVRYQIPEEQVENTIANLEHNYTATINFFEQQTREYRSLLNSLGLHSYSPNYTQSAVDSMVFATAREFFAQDTAYKSKIQATLEALFTSICRAQYGLGVCTAILESKRKEHDRLQNRATQRKDIAENFKAILLEEYETMQKEQERLAEMDKQLSERIDTQKAEEERFNAWLQHIKTIKEEISALQNTHAE